MAQVQENSPGQKAGLEAFFDFIIAICDTRLDKNDDTLKELLKANIDKPIKFTIYSSKTQTVREEIITPSQTWGGQGNTIKIFFFLKVFVFTNLPLFQGFLGFL